MNGLDAFSGPSRHRQVQRCSRLPAAGARWAKGFGLLEALVALVIFSVSGLALFSWINNSLASAARLSERQSEVHARAEALAWLQTIDPLAQARGETELSSNARLRWTARAVSPLTSGAPFPGGVSSPFRLTLFEVEATLERSDRRPPLALKISRVGVERDPVQTVQP